MPKTNDPTQEPWRKYRLEEEKWDRPDTFTVKLNPIERAMLDRAKKILRQKKNSTALKQLAEIGYKCITSPLTGQIMETVFKNKRKNNRLGIVEFEVDDMQK